MEKFGIENLKKVYVFLIGAGMKLDKDLEDGKLSTAEDLEFLPDLLQIPGIYQGAKNIPDEVADLSDTESEELKTYLATTLNLRNDKVECAIKHANNILLEAVEMRNCFKTTMDAPAK